MMKTSVSILIIFVLCIFNYLTAHSTYYPHVAMKQSKNTGVRTLPNPPPGIISYHIHITYTLFNPDVCIN